MGIWEYGYMGIRIYSYKVLGYKSIRVIYWYEYLVQRLMEFY